MENIIFISTEENRKPECLNLETFKKEDFEANMAFIRKLLNSDNIVYKTHRIGQRFYGVFYDEKTIERRNYNLCLEDKETQSCLLGNIVVVDHYYSDYNELRGIYCESLFEVGFAIQQKCNFINGKKVKHYVLEINE